MDPFDAIGSARGEPRRTRSPQQLPPADQRLASFLGRAGARGKARVKYATYMLALSRFLDHVAFNVSDLSASRHFYAAALRPWGAREVTSGAAFGYGPEGSEDLWIAHGTPGPALHIALAAPSRAIVDAFHSAALAGGGRDNGPPGIRPQYHPDYYAAYALDPDGNNVEAVHHGSHSQGF